MVFIKDKPTDVNKDDTVDVQCIYD